MILPEYTRTYFYAVPPNGRWPSDFHIITAWNPKRPVSDEENDVADKRLRLVLELESHTIFRVMGYSQDMTDVEHGWGALGIDHQRAVEIGREYGQNAIFEVSGGELSVVCCDAGSKQALGSFLARELVPPSRVGKEAKTCRESVLNLLEMVGDIRATVGRSKPSADGMRTVTFIFPPNKKR